MVLTENSLYVDQELVSDLTKQIIVTPVVLQSFERSVVPLSVACSFLWQDGISLTFLKSF